MIDLINIEKPEESYIVFETKTEEGVCLTVIPIQGKKNLRLGRGYDSDLRLSDISVSRNHANIKVKNSGLYLEDLQSKFGTLIKISKDICLDNDSKIQLQCGRTVLKMKIFRP
jgi:FOG: FHA domain